MPKATNTILRVKFASGPKAERFEEFKIIDRSNLVNTTRIEDLCNETDQVFDLEFAAGQPYMVLQYTINNHDYQITRYDEENPDGITRVGQMPYNGNDEISLMIRELRLGTATRESVLGYMNGIADRLQREAEEEAAAQAALEAAEEEARRRANEEALAAQG